MERKQQEAGENFILKGFIISHEYWVFGLCPTSGILKNTKEHNV
jgi:hypothetical protein